MKPYDLCKLNFVEEIRDVKVRKLKLEGKNDISLIHFIVFLPTYIIFPHLYIHNFGHMDFKWKKNYMETTRH